MHARSVLEAAVCVAPRRYLLPALPADAAMARRAVPATALAFAIECAREGRHAQPEVQAVFVEALAALISSALAPDTGDATFQALVWRAQHPEVEEYARLSLQLHAHRRVVRSAVDAVAHPGRTRGLPPGAELEVLSRLHQLAREGDWSALRKAANSTLPELADSDAMNALVRVQALGQLANVRRYEELCRQRGPQARSPGALGQGRAAARVGDDAEQATVDAFARICALLQSVEPGATAYGVLRGLRPPAGLLGDAHRAKDEWDAAIVAMGAPEAPADILLLAEVKASPAAATPDWSRLIRGLQRLSSVDAHAAPEFASAGRDVRISGASLREVAPAGTGLPAHVIYCCSSAPQEQPVLLSAASQAVLLAESQAVAFGRALATGDATAPQTLLPIWYALTTQPRLRSVLHQYDTSCKARSAMLHPDDLVAAVRAQLEAVAPGQVRA